MTSRRITATALAIGLLSRAAGLNAAPPANPVYPSPPTAPTVALSPAGVANAPSALLTFEDFLRRLAVGNLDLAAQKKNVSIAQATVSIARVFPNPALTFGLAQVDPFGTGNGNASFVGVSVPFQLGGKRAARIDVAEANVSATESELDDALRQLRADGADLYVDAVYSRLVLVQKRLTLESLERLVSVNKQRFAAGDVGEVVVLQSKVEADVFRAEVLASEGSVRSADLSLIQGMGAAGKGLSGTALDVRGDLKKAADHHLDLNALLTLAKARRPDLIAARRRVVLADKQIDLANANRIIDLSVYAGWQHNFPAPSGGVGGPAADLFSLNLTVPLPFSNIYRGEVHVAVATKDQSSLAVQAAEVRIDAEVRKAVVRYDAASTRVRLFTAGTLANASEVLERTLYNYHRGGATLVEVLVAQRTANEVYLTYYEALAEAAHALVAVDRATSSSTVEL